MKELPKIELSYETPLERAFLEVMPRLFALWKIRNRRYGTRNIAGLGERGVFARAWDKTNRLFTLVWEGEQLTAIEEEAESILDTWMDLAVYGIIAVLVREGNWPGTPNYKGEDKTEDDAIHTG